MKKNIQLLLITLTAFSLTLFTSCNNDDSDDPEPSTQNVTDNPNNDEDGDNNEEDDNNQETPDNSTLSATLNGQPWTPASLQVSSFSGSILISMTSLANEISTLGIVLNDDVVPGTYRLGSATFSGTVNSTTPIFGQSGSTITIISHDTEARTITGTFSGTVSDSFFGSQPTESFRFTNGAFNLNYTQF